MEKIEKNVEAVNVPAVTILLLNLHEAISDIGFAVSVKIALPFLHVSMLAVKKLSMST
jgi:hypothetical protein